MWRQQQPITMLLFSKSTVVYFFGFQFHVACIQVKCLIVGLVMWFLYFVWYVLLFMHIHRISGSVSRLLPCRWSFCRRDVFVNIWTAKVYNASYINTLRALFIAFKPIMSREKHVLNFIEKVNEKKLSCPSNETERKLIN